MAILETNNLKKYYGSGDTMVKALDGLNFSVENGEFIAIIGTSGSGKSTLLHMIGGLDRPTSGTVKVAGKDIFSLKDDALTIFGRRKIGFMFQSYNVVPVLNAYENIVLPLRLDGEEPDEAFLEELVTALGIKGKLGRMPQTLSGGQQQRAAIARALVTKPAILLADEPTGSLDSVTGMEVMGLLRTCADRFRQTVVLVTHQEAAAQMADRVLRMSDGRLSGDKGGGRL